MQEKAHHPNVNDQSNRLGQLNCAYRVVRDLAAVFRMYQSKRLNLPVAADEPAERWRSPRAAFGDTNLRALVKVD